MQAAMATVETPSSRTASEHGRTISVRHVGVAGSDLLFPAVTAASGHRRCLTSRSPRSPSRSSSATGYAFTQSAMRRTFNDRMRAAQVEAILTRSISGHLTERVHEHYSTVSGAEQRAGIAKDHRPDGSQQA